MSSWDMLGTNLSVAHGDGVFSTESDRLLLMDRKDFNVLGMGLDDLIEAYIQTVCRHIVSTGLLSAVCIGLPCMYQYGYGLCIQVSHRRNCGQPTGGHGQWYCLLRNIHSSGAV